MRRSSARVSRVVVGREYETIVPDLLVALTGITGVQLAGVNAVRVKVGGVEIHGAKVVGAEVFEAERARAGVVVGWESPGQE